MSLRFEGERLAVITAAAATEAEEEFSGNVENVVGLCNRGASDDLDEGIRNILLLFTRFIIPERESGATKEAL